MITLPITPVPKPRMTQRDRWKKRACVTRYWAYKDQLQLLVDPSALPESMHLVFVLPMPRSWSKRKRARMAGTPHQSKPDIDNLCKGFLDAIFEQDQAVFDVRTTKLWGTEGAILIRELPALTLPTVAA